MTLLTADLGILALLFKAEGHVHSALGGHPMTYSRINFSETNHCNSEGFT